MAADAHTGAYRVLARKYRPKGFEDLIGQEAMVRTLTNAFAAERIHQAYIFTGVRGVGKTTTARIIARALNYETEDGSITKPTIAMPAYGRHCEAIIESRHVDVIEMDAASNTSVNDVREIIEAVRYRPAYARYKVYIIDEVHMLSGSAFNALLKTLEEPPEHVKFLFATTEIKKVPVTVLSRCQRFDLKRIPGGLMVDHLRGICGQENVTATDEALAMIARAGEGSVRDSLSLLDQAIAHGSGADGAAVDADRVRDMLGLADRARVIDLFGIVMRGDIAGALAELSAQYDSGADPAAVITDLAEFVHTVTRLKLSPGAEEDTGLTEIEKARGKDFARDLSIRNLTRSWQILTKGLTEVQLAPRPIVAAEMLLVRLAYASDLPTPDEALKMLKDGTAATAAGTSAPAPRGGGGGAAASAAARPVIAVTNPERLVQPTSAPAQMARISISSLPQLVALAQEKRDILTATALRADVRLVRLEDGVIEFSLARGADNALVQRLGQKLMDWTGRRWIVSLSSEQGDPTIAEMEDAAGVSAIEKLETEHPVVKAIKARWPDAKVRPPVRKPDPRPAFEALSAQAVVNEDGDVVAGEADFTEDDL